MLKMIQNCAQAINYEFNYFDTTEPRIIKAVINGNVWIVADLTEQSPEYIINNIYEKIQSLVINNLKELNNK